MNANELLTLIKERRSYRQFSEQQITDEQLNSILEAGLYGPSAGGRQSSHFLVIQDKELNLKLGKINRAAMVIRPDSKVNAYQPSIIDDPEIDNGFYDAPTVITIISQKDSLYGKADCAVSGQNMLLMAEALGLGACMLGRAPEVFESELGKQILRDNDFAEDQQAYYHIVVGYPKGKTFCKERNLDRIKKITG